MLITTETHLSKTGSFLIPVSYKKPHSSVSLLSQFKRFLILGTTSSICFPKPEKYFKNHLSIINKVFETEGVAAFDLITEISQNKLGISNEPCIYALSVALNYPNLDVRRMASILLPKICHTTLDLYHFMSYSNRGGGRLFQKAISNWFKRPVKPLSYLLLAHQNNSKWSTKDILKVARPTPHTPSHSQLYGYITQGKIPVSKQLTIIKDYENLNKDNILEIITKHHLSIEMIPNSLRTAEVYSKLLSLKPGIPWVLRNLPIMTLLGLFDYPSSKESVRVTELLSNKNEIDKAQIHPLSYAIALDLYKSGRNLNSKLSWTPVSVITEVLTTAFQYSFKCFSTTGKTFMIGLDVSGSMDWASHYNCPNLKTRNVGVILALSLVNSNKNTSVYAFGNSLIPLPITPATSYQNAVRITNINMGSVDPGLLIQEALNTKKYVDTFLVFTDNDIRSGRNVNELFAKYKKTLNSNAKLIFCAMKEDFSEVANPEDECMLDIVGESKDLPQIIKTFSEL
jgi:60 kDa SS-A/Ro ribonucleoprotein